MHAVILTNKHLYELWWLASNSSRYVRYVLSFLYFQLHSIKLCLLSSTHNDAIGLHDNLILSSTHLVF